MKKIYLFLIALVITLTSVNAQLGGLLKKAKEKVDTKTEKSETKPNSTPTTPIEEASKEKPQTQPQSTEYPTQGITSDAHKKYMGKIVFGPKFETIAFSKEIESDFKNDFTFGDPIYLRAYMANSLSNYLISAFPNTNKDELNSNAYFMAHFFIDGVETYSKRLEGLQQDENKEWTTIKGALRTEDKFGTPMFRGEYKMFLTELDGKLSNGTHKIKIEVRPYAMLKTPLEGGTIATGEFTLTVKPTSINTNDPVFCLEKANMSDPKIEAATMKEYALEKGNSTQVKYARIRSKDWEIVRHKLTGLILRRNLELVVIAINKEGKYVHKRCYISQEYVGGKFQDKIAFSSDANETRINSRCFN